MGQQLVISSETLASSFKNLPEMTGHDKVYNFELANAKCHEASIRRGE
jgi:hypothetical protein